MSKKIKEIEKEAKERISYVRTFAQGTMPVCVLVDEDDLPIYNKVMKKMRRVSNLSLKVIEK